MAPGQDMTHGHDFMMQYYTPMKVWPGIQLQDANCIVSIRSDLWIN